MHAKSDLRVVLKWVVGYTTMKLEWITAVAFASIAIYLNCDAGRVRISSTGIVKTRPSPAIQFAHGWPAMVFVREGLFSPSTGKSVYPPAGYARLGGYEAYSRFPIDGSPIIFLSVRNAAINVLSIILATMGICGITKSLHARGYLPTQFRLQTVFVVVFLVSVLLALRSFLPKPYEIFHVALLLVSVMSMFVGVLFAIVDLARRLTRWQSV